MCRNRFTDGRWSKVSVHVDTEGNAYDFGFGLNWKGVINDKRVMTYKRKKVATK